MGRYHHGDLETALIEAGLVLISEKGPEAFTLREVARRVGVSHTAAYRHFKDKSALLAAIAERGFQALTEAVAMAAEASDDPVEAFSRTGAAYVGFALANPAAFRVMFRKWDAPPPSLEAAGTASFEQLLATILQARGAGVLVDEPPYELALAAWSGVHGLARLLVDEALPPALTAHPIDLERVGALLVRGLLVR